jgi:hypothetical protein
MVLKKSLKTKNQVGQASVEMVLLMVLGVAVIFSVFKGLQETNFIGKMIGDPWAKVAGMVECGVWQPCGIGAPKAKLHPGQGSRTLSYKITGQ